MIEMNFAFYVFGAVLAIMFVCVVISVISRRKLEGINNDLVEALGCVLKAQDVERDYVTGRDIISPNYRAHIKRIIAESKGEA